MTGTDRQASMIEQYRRGMIEIGARDEVALVDHRVEQLWADAVAAAGPALDDHTYDCLEPTVAPAADAPADLDIHAHLDHIQRRIHGEPPPADEPSSWWTSARSFGIAWLAACAIFALLLGVSVNGLVVVPAFVPAIGTGLALLGLGVGRTPGWLWAIGLLPLVALLLGGPPRSGESDLDVSAPWFVGVIFLLLVSGFARWLALAGEQRLQRLADSGEHVDQRMSLSNERRPLELELMMCTFGALTIGPDVADLILLPSGLALIRRRRWTCILAAAVSVVMFFVAVGDAQELFGGSWAHVVVLAALTTHWIRALFSDAWRQRLTRTELAMSITSRLAGAAYRSTQQRLTGQASQPWLNPELPTPVTTGPNQTQPPRYPQGQFGRYCGSCMDVTPHVPGGLSLPVCVQCGTHTAGGGTPV